MNSGYIVQKLIKKKIQNEFPIYCTLFNPKNGTMTSGYILKCLIKKWQNEFPIYGTVFNPKNGKINSGYIVQYFIQKMAK